LWTSTEFRARRDVPELEEENAAEAIFHVLDKELT
jgi:hypothetical protein